MTMNRLVFLDTETTSLDDTRGEVWEIGAIVRDAAGDTEHLWQLWPDLETADPNSLRISRFYERNLLAHLTVRKDAVRIPIDGSELDIAADGCWASEVANNVALLLDGAHVVGAVPDFDHRFLRRWLVEEGQCWTAHYHLIDVEALAVGWLYGKAAMLAKERPNVDWTGDHAGGLFDLPWKSTDLYRALGLDPDKYEAHTALGDARLVRDVYDAVTARGGDRG
jgi:DNA polymerase III epsilon subunit-like protein